MQQTELNINFRKYVFHNFLIKGEYLLVEKSSEFQKDFQP